MTQTPRYDAMCRAIDDVFKSDPGEAIQDKTARLEYYLRLAKNTEPERQATEIRLRAERKMKRIHRPPVPPEMGFNPPAPPSARDPLIVRCPHGSGHNNYFGLFFIGGF